MTAYEVGQRVQEFIRNTLPLFEPLEQDYNGQICEQTVELIVRNSPEVLRSAPKSIQGAKLQFLFESPLREATERVKMGQFLEAQQVLAAAIQLDPALRHIVNGRKATRDVLEAVAPADWMRTDGEVDEMVANEEAQVAAAQTLQTMQQGADVAATLAKARPSPGGSL
jgi:hypothetical protein